MTLLTRVRQGDAAALSTLYRRHSGVVFRHARIHAPHCDAAADATQETFLWLATQGAFSYDRAQGSLAAFLCGVVRNQVLRIRAQDARQPLSLEDVEAPSPDGDEDAIQDALAPLLAQERGQALLDALRELPPEHREVVALIEFEEFSYAETAAILGCAIGTVRSRLHRAKAALHQRLMELFPPERRNAA